MQYFYKPKSVTLKKLINQNTGKPGVELTFDDMLEQMVFVLPVWRSSKDYLEAAKRLRDSIADAKDGGEVECKDSDHEKLVLELQRLDLQGKSHLVEAVNNFTYSLMCANKTPSVQPAESAPDN